ncbi:MAG: hypothetical protein AAFV54_12510, partial [Pseudomonadota bacterium]
TSEDAITAHTSLVRFGLAFLAFGLGLPPALFAQSTPTNENVSVVEEDSGAVGASDAPTSDAADGVPAEESPQDADTRFKDRDLTRNASQNAELFDVLDIVETVQEFDNRQIRLTELRRADREGDTFYFVMHDEEDEAFDAMIWAVANFGGTGIAIENSEQRLLEGNVDINRQFCRADRPDLNYFFRSRIESADVVIALHNNLDHPLGNMHLNNSSYFTEMCDAGDDVDDILITGEISNGDPAFCERPDIVSITEGGLNVAWARFADRRSFAFNCTERCNFQRFVISYLGQTYFNLETQHDNGSDKQKRQICAILDPERADDACAEIG